MLRTCVWLYWRVQVSTGNAGAEDKAPYNEEDVVNSMKRIETINFHQTKDVSGIRFTPYHAGHVLGACMYLIEIAGVKILYTGDFSSEEDRHLVQAEVPSGVKVDILITEATFGVRNHEPVQSREARFTDYIHKTLNRGGKCLIPAFALGRAQELLLILDDYWQKHPELQGIPIYYMGQLAVKCLSVYAAQIHSMNAVVLEQWKQGRNPFRFKHIENIKSVSNLDDSAPCVALASPGMLQSGASRDLFEKWCQDSKNSIIIAGYAVQGTLAKDLLDEPTEVQSADGRKLVRRMQIHEVSFAAHVDFDQNRAFICAVKPRHIILVHAEENEMRKFMERFKVKHEADFKFDMYNPENTKSVLFSFRGEKKAKVIGSAARHAQIPGAKLSGFLFRRSFNYFIVAPDELAVHTDNKLELSSVRQKQAIAYPYGLALLQHHLLLIYGLSVKIVEKADAPTEITVMDSITVIHNDDEQMLTMEWDANTENDMWAESILATVLQIESSPETVKLSRSCGGHDQGAAVASTEALAMRLREHLEELFGNCVATEDGSALTVTVDKCVVSVQTTGKFEVSAAQKDDKKARQLAEQINKARKKFILTVQPDLFN